MMLIEETPDAIAKFVFYGVMACWTLFAATFWLRKRPPAGEVTRRDWTATVSILIQAVAGGSLGLRSLQRTYFSPIFPMPKAAELLLAVLTVASAVLSVWLVNAAVRRLGKQWAVAARLVEGHKLITDGPYRLVRNPIYTGMFGMLIATGLAVSRWNTLLIAILVFALGTYMRIRIEERLLRGHFGNEFDEYARKVPAVIPGVW
jgi:protein-S-isoprenylcysteine O-methyltransferase Ste14